MAPNGRDIPVDRPETAGVHMANLVDSWLNGIGLGYAVPIFAGQGIDSPDMLSELDVVDFPELGISDQNDRKKVCSSPVQTTTAVTRAG